MQEMKRRYLSMYSPNETVDDQFNEHCGVCDEQGIEEAKPPRKLAKRDVGMECMECGNKFRAKLSTLQYGKTKCPKCKSTDLDFAYGESVEEEVEIEEEFWAVIDKAKGGEVMAVSSDEKGAKSSVKMSNFSKHDYHFNKDPRTLKIVKVMGKHSQKKAEKMIGTKLSFKEEIEVDENFAVLNEALKPRDKAVIDAFYSRKGNLASNLLSVEGGKLTKMGMGGQEIAIWKNDKIVINAKMDVKSTEEIVRYMKKSIPSGVFEEVEIEESNELQAIMALDDAGIEATINKKDQVVIKKKDLKKAEKALKKSFKKGGAPELHTEEVEIDEAVNLKKLKKEYEKNEDDNYHRENYLLLAKAFGTKSEIKKVEEIMKRSEANNSTSQKDNDWMYKNIMPYYNKIRNEEVDMDEAKLYAAKGTAYPATIDTLRKIVKDKQHQTVMFKSGQAIVDLFTANAMVQVYDALKKPEMKKTFEKMIGDKAGFLKTQAFAMKMLSGGK